MTNADRSRDPVAGVSSPDPAELFEYRTRHDAALLAPEFGTWLWDIPSDTVRGDENLDAMFGFSPTVSGGRPIADYFGSIHPEDLPKIAAAIERTIATGARYEEEYRTVVAGRERWVSARGFLKRDGNGAPVEFSGVLVDISNQKALDAERQHLLEQLKTQARIFDTTLSAITDFAYIFDLQGRFLYANKALLSLWGLTLEQAVGKNFFDLQYPEALASRLQQQIQQVIATRTGLVDETPYTSPTGAGGVYEYILSPVFAHDGSVEVVAGSTREVTVRKQAAEALENADRRKNEFLAMLAHELRNPLAPIGNAAEFVARARTQDEPVQKSMGIIRRQISHLTHLVDDLLDVSRISQGRIDLKIESLDLATVVAQAVETVGPLIREKQHDLTIVSAYRALGVRGDPTRLAQCVANILTNAAKYTDTGGHIELSCRPHGQDVVISISDNGVGVPAELLPRLFDLFVQGDRTLDRAQGGLGIGLAVVKRLVEMHGGTVAAYSPGSGRGSTFEIRLPRIETIEEPQRTSSQGKAPLQRVLIVDDNVDAANSLSRLISFDGHETRAVYTAEDALLSVASFKPSVILLDIGLPKMDGHEVARRVRELPDGKSIRLVAVTGYGQPDDRQRTRDAGFDLHLVKPIDLAALASIVSG